MKRSVWVPIAFFIVGCAFYVYYGITWNAWIVNLYKIVIYGFILIALHWVMKKKDEISNNKE